MRKKRPSKPLTPDPKLPSIDLGDQRMALPRTPHIMDLIRLSQGSETFNAAHECGTPALEEERQRKMAAKTEPRSGANQSAASQGRKR
jgi:hypothetical protein